MHSPILIAQLVDLFADHSGIIHPRVLISDGFNISELEDAGLIYRSPSHLDGGCFLVGSELEKEVQGV